MIAYYGSAISGNISVTPEGYLICKNVPIARTGTQEYLPGELGMAGEEPVRVYRAEAEVFHPATMASFEGKPITCDHPPADVDVRNVSAFARGHLQNVRRGRDGERDLLIADLFITDPALAERIRSGELREVSCGYRCEYAADGAGRIFQRSIRGNHVAVVEAGRAGSRVAIRDSVPNMCRKGNGNMKRQRHASMLARAFSGWAKDADPDELATAVDELIEEQTADEDIPTDPVLAAINRLCEKIDALLAARVADDDPLDQLAGEVCGDADEPNLDEDPLTVPIEQDEDIEQQDEDIPAEPDSENAKAVMAAIGAVKPIIAALPPEQRLAASDAAARRIRAAIGRDARPRRNGYIAIARGTRRAATRDSRATDAGRLGREIMAKRNPHYRKGNA